MNNINGFYYYAVDLLKKLIEIPSLSQDEAAAANLLQKYLQRRNLYPKRTGNNVWVMSPFWDRNKPTILLNSHIDTVKPVAGWTRDPFTPVEEEGKLYGLGSNDAGASLVSLLATFLHLCQCDLVSRSSDDKRNYIFLASCEEEISGQNGIELVLPELPPIALAVVGEPTGMQPAIAERGLMVLDVLVHGKSGHAARHEGVNAIYKALTLIEWFKNMHFEKTGDLLGAVKTTVTMIDAGTQHNVVPDLCHFTVDIRSNERYTNEELFKYIKSRCWGDVSARSLRLNSSSIDPKHPIVQRAKELNLEPYGSPTLSDQALMPFPSIKIGPGASERSHTADEFVYLAEIRQAINVYLKLLEGA
ncbi:peptidase dimerisation domain [Candidatus Symbiothrix dinenymphae]|nr:peptidase dimerisation domain [Candidatus Symbiothrix dinenymphae]